MYVVCRRFPNSKVFLDAWREAAAGRNLLGRAQSEQSLYAPRRLALGSKILDIMVMACTSIEVCISGGIESGIVPEGYTVCPSISLPCPNAPTLTHAP